MGIKNHFESIWLADMIKLVIFNLSIGLNVKDWLDKTIYSILLKEM